MKRHLVAVTLLLLAGPALAQTRTTDPWKSVQAIMDAAIQEAINAGETPHPPQGESSATLSTETEALALRAFEPIANAPADVDAALIAARTSGKHVLLIMGGNWCHDSMALWGEFHSPRFAAMLADRYEIVWVDVGHRDRNLDIARRFGLSGIDGTPTVLILTPDGTATNLADAPSWRNAGSRKPEAIYRHFSRAVAPVSGR